MKNSFDTYSLSDIEATIINGGETRYVVEYSIFTQIVLAIWDFSRQASEYQASLPPNLKK